MVPFLECGAFQGVIDALKGQESILKLEVTSRACELVCRFDDLGVGAETGCYGSGVDVVELV